MSVFKEYLCLCVQGTSMSMCSKNIYVYVFKEYLCLCVQGISMFSRNALSTCLRCSDIKECAAICRHIYECAAICRHIYDQLHHRRTDSQPPFHSQLSWTHHIQVCVRVRAYVFVCVCVCILAFE